MRNTPANRSRGGRYLRPNLLVDKVYHTERRLCYDLRVLTLLVGSRSCSNNVDAIVFEGKSINQRSWVASMEILASPVYSTVLDTN
jgi:hypothetical protein